MYSEYRGRMRSYFSLLTLGLCLVALSACQTTTSQVAPTLTPILGASVSKARSPFAFKKIVMKVPRHRPIGKIIWGYSVPAAR